MIPKHTIGSNALCSNALRSNALCSNAHTHTTFCDGADSAEELVRHALSLGFISLGFSGHSYYPDCSHYCMSPEGTLQYQAEIRRLQAAYQDRITVRLGLELDYFSQVDLAPYEYIIGSVHHFRDPSSHIFYAFDGSADHFRQMLDQSFNGNILALARAYYSMLAQLVTQPQQGRRIDIVGHFNLITKQNRVHHLIDESDPAYQKIAYEALRACAQTGAIFEVNTGAMARGYANEPYPNLEMLRWLHELKAPVIVTSDCHAMACLDFAFEEARQLLLTAGYRSVMRLGRNSLFEEVAL